MPAASMHLALEHSTPRRLRAFVETVDAESLSGAARRLATTEPAISQHVTALEKLAGTTLVIRERGRRPQLTVDGRAFYAYARAVIAACEESAARPTLRVAASTVVGERLVGPELRSLVRGGAFAEAKLFVSTSEGVAESVTRGMSDIGFVGDAAAPGLRKWEIGMDSVLIFSRGQRSRISIDALRRAHIIVPQVGDGVRGAFDRWRARHDAQHEIAIEEFGTQMSVLTSLEGDDLGIASSLLRASAHPLGLRALPFPGEPLNRVLYAITLGEPQKSQTMLMDKVSRRFARMR